MNMKGNPASGEYAAAVLEGNSNLQKALYVPLPGIALNVSSVILRIKYGSIT